jgi:hypothetical protein
VNDRHPQLTLDFLIRLQQRVQELFPIPDEQEQATKAVIAASGDFPDCDEAEFQQHIDECLEELKREWARPRRTSTGLPQSRDEQRRRLIGMSLDFPFPCEEHGDESVRVDLSRLNENAPLVLIVSKKFFDTELRKVGSRLVLRRVKGIPRLYVRPLTSSQTDSWLADFVATRKYKGWHMGFNRCVRLREESASILDYRESNVYVSWMEKDYTATSPDAPMEIGNRYVAQIFRPDSVTADETYARPTKAKRTDTSHFDEPNVLAHVRYDERPTVDGKRTLFINELQSDWHLKGRQEGYQNPAPTKLPDGVYIVPDNGFFQVVNRERKPAAASNMGK